MDRQERLQASKNLGRAMRKALSVRGAENLMNRALMNVQTNRPLVMNDRPEEYIEEGYEFNPDVYSVINGITNSASAVPPVVFEVKDEAKARKYYRFKHSNRYKAQSGYAERSMELKEEAFEEAPESDLAQLIDRPNPHQAFPEFLENLLGFKYITGNSYAHGVELTDGRMGELWVMPAHLTEIIAGKSTEAIVKEYRLRAYQVVQSIPADTVMHLKYWNPDYSYAGSHLYGMSPLKAARRTIRAGNDGKEALSRAFANNGAAGMIYPKDPDISSLNAQQQRQIERHFKQYGAGPKNYKSVLAMSAEMGWTPFGMPPVDLEILEAAKMSMRDICNVYSYPSELLNDPDNKTNTNKKESRKQLYQEVVIPDLERTYAELNRWLTQPYTDTDGNMKPARFGDERTQYHIDYDATQIEALQEDVGEKVQWLKDAWWIPPNQKLKEMNMDRIDDPTFDEPWVDMGRLPLSEIMASTDFTQEEAKLLKQEYMLNGHN